MSFKDGLRERADAVNQKKAEERVSLAISRLKKDCEEAAEKGDYKVKLPLRDGNKPTEYYPLCLVDTFSTTFFKPMFNDRLKDLGLKLSEETGQDTYSATEYYVKF